MVRMSYKPVDNT